MTVFSTESANSALVMGVINITPDSFSDGGAFLDPGAAFAKAESLIAEGADVLDLGAESTKPGAVRVDEDEEWRRLEPVLKALLPLRSQAKISIDTRKPSLMLRAADLGVSFINNVDGLADIGTLTRLARYPNLAFIAMHMHGQPQTMQRDPLAAHEAVGTVGAFFDDATRTLRDAGFSADRIWMDPGIGFGKTDGGNLRLMAAAPRWAEKHQLAYGISRKSLIGRTLGIAIPAERDAPSKMLELGLVIAGARMIRTHDVRRLKLLLNLLRGGE